MLKLRQLQQAPAQYAGHVEVGGWVRTVREGKTVGFIELTDGSAFRPVQVVYENDARGLGRGLSTGCAITVAGELCLTPSAAQRAGSPPSHA